MPVALNRFLSLFSCLLCGLDKHSCHFAEADRRTFFAFTDINANGRRMQWFFGNKKVPVYACPVPALRPRSLS